MRAFQIAVLLLAAIAGVGSPLAAAPEDAKVTPGEFVIEHPTLINLGFEWHIDGDANRNASVDVSFRKQGETAWRKAMPLARLHGEQVFQRNVFNLVTPNMFAGSILDLEPGTAYEARFVMTDPDGVNGPAANATKIVTARTRPEPLPAAGGKTYHVYPTKWQGPKTEPAFEGIMCAYNYYCGAGDTAPGGRPRVKPGDTILVHAGTYAYHYEFYANNTQINTNYSSSDYNGFRPNPGNESFQWNSPPPSVPRILADGTGSTKLETRKFATLDAYTQATEQDRHSVLVDYDIFMKVTRLDAKDLATVQRLYEAKDLDFALRPGSAAVDRGIELPNITDGFTGQAPDLGALEVGRPAPVYGPRPR